MNAATTDARAMMPRRARRLSRFQDAIFAFYSSPGVQAAIGCAVVIFPYCTYHAARRLLSAHTCVHVRVSPPLSLALLLSLLGSTCLSLARSLARSLSRSLALSPSLSLARALSLSVHICANVSADTVRARTMNEAGTGQASSRGVIEVFIVANSKDTSSTKLQRHTSSKGQFARSH